MPMSVSQKCPEGGIMTVWLDNGEKCDQKSCHMKSCRYHPSNFKEEKK